MNFRAKTVLLLFAFFVNLTALAAPPNLAAESKEHPTPTTYKEAAPIRTFKRITSTDQLISGRRYLIAYGGEDYPTEVFVAKNISKDGNLDSDNLQLEGQNELSIQDDNYSFILLQVASGSNKAWVIQQQNGKYLKVEKNSSWFYLADKQLKDCRWNINSSSNGIKFIFQNQNQRNYRIVRTSSNNKFSVSESKYSTLVLFQEVLDPATVSISSVGYATLYYGDRALIVPEGVVAKTYAVENGLLVNTKEYVAGDVIPQATAVVLKGKEGTYTFESATTEGAAPEKSDLYGYDTEQNTSVDNAKYYYKLSLDDNGANVGFYWGQDNGAAFTSGAHKAFLAVKEAIASKAFSFDKEVTAVKSVGLNPARDAVFTLAGVRMLPSRLPAGVYIKNGKKIIVK